MTLKLKTLSLIALMATTSMASAVGMTDPIMAMEPMDIEAASASSSGSADILIPLILIALIAAAASRGGGGEILNG